MAKEWRHVTDIYENCLAHKVSDLSYIGHDRSVNFLGVASMLRCLVLLCFAVYLMFQKLHVLKLNYTLLESPSK